MKTIKDFINENNNTVNHKITATYYFNSDNKENGYSNNVSDAHPDLSKKVLNIISNHWTYSETIDKIAQLNKSGFKSSLEIEYIIKTDSDVFDDIDKLIKELSDLNNISFIEYFHNEIYKTN